METQLSFLFLIPLALAAFAVYWYGIRPTWRRVVDRCENLDDRDAQEKAGREAAERELHGDANP